MTLEELELTIHTYHVLKRHGINDVDEIKSMTYEELVAIRGMSMKIVRELELKLGISIF